MPVRTKEGRCKEEAPLEAEPPGLADTEGALPGDVEEPEEPVDPPA